MTETTNIDSAKGKILMMALVLAAFVALAAAGSASGHGGAQQVAARGTDESVVQRTTIETGELEDFLEDLAYQELNNFWAQNFAYLEQTTAANDQYASTEEFDTYYTPANLEVVSDEPVETACGTEATSEDAMFYCGSDNTIYYGLAGELEMVEQFGPFDFANAMAHEWGHHLQNQLGYSDARDESNDVAFENQADCFAGVWAASYDYRYDLSEEDIQLAMEAQATLGDDKTEEEGKDHGSPEERVYWFSVGLETGDPAQCTTFYA